MGRLPLGAVRDLLDVDGTAPGRATGSAGGTGAGEVVSSTPSALVDALTRPLGRAALRFGLPLPPWTVALRWSPVSGLIVVPVPSEPRTVELQTCHASALPDVVAGLVDLGPRPTPEEVREIVLPAEALDAWLRGAPRSVADVVAPDPDSRRVLLDVRDRLVGSWSVTSELPTTDCRKVRRTLRVVDSGTAGLWLVHRYREAGGVATLVPLSTRDVWAGLTGVLATRPVREAAA